MMLRKSRLIPLFAVLIFAACGDDDNSPQAPATIDLSTSFYVEVNLKDRTDDTFKVRMFVDELTADNAVFQFPATVPGTYNICNIGRFVKGFKAYDEKYHELPVSHTLTNQWVLDDPENTHLIEFQISETFDMPVATNQVYKMAGTSLEDDHSLLNLFDVIGYPEGLKERDFYLDVDHPTTWGIGTSLLKASNGFYFATDYDKLVDNPMLIGNISTASTTVDNAQINVFTYSKDNLIQSDQILSDLQSILDDANAFLNGLPVDRYSFLYFFDQYNPVAGLGALEHSYSSVYAFVDQPHTTSYGATLRNFAAHEFFHVVTPLNIHSEIIEDFNFAEPTPSEHLWLYEGVTEWASHMMQYRNGHLALTDMLNRFRVKKITADGYNQSISLSQMSLTCYTTGGSQFGNVYNKGALVAALLDIRLLELSNGTRGLREVILELIDTYGPDHAFSEATFFDDLTAMTYPEIEDFISLYIKGTEALPLEEYFAKIGIAFEPATSGFTPMDVLSEQQQMLFDKWRMNF